jgi:hypothetical protein
MPVNNGNGTVTEYDAPVIDGFIQSTSLLLLPTSYRALQIAQMEVLRRAKGYTARWYTRPTSKAIPAYYQRDDSFTVKPGSYLWGWYFSAVGVTTQAVMVQLYLQISEQDTGLRLISDYATAQCLTNQVVPAFGARGVPRLPFLFAQPRMVSGSGKINVEIYNSTASALQVQLVIFAAEPCQPLDPCDDRIGKCSQE